MSHGKTAQNEDEMAMPYRYVGLEFSIDTNRINARQKCAAMNQLEIWRQNGVIEIDMCDVAQGEASKGDATRFEKASDYIYPITLDSHRTSAEFRGIRDILFAGKASLTPNEVNDVTVVFHAKANHCILVTNDGGSKRQPNGILGNRERLLEELGITVMRDIEAVALVAKRIKERDMRAERVALTTGEALPDWVAKDH